MIQSLPYKRTFRFSLTAFRHVTTTCSNANTEFPSIDYILSETCKNDCMNKFKNIKLPQRELNEANRIRAAVLIPLCVVKEELSLLYTLRKADLKRHRGQVSFPGGMEDPSDSSLEYTALRETEEELGIRKEDLKLWGSGSIYVGKEFSVLPVVAYLGKIEIDQLRPNPDEVDVVFSLPLKHFCKTENCKSTQFRYQDQSYVLPVFINGEYRVWGITALITHILLASLLPKNYKHKLNLIKPVTLTPRK